MNTTGRIPHLTRSILVVSMLAAGLLSSSAQLGQIALRPLTPDNIADLGLPASTQVSGGLHSVGLGQPAYLEVQVDTNRVKATNILGVSWNLAVKPFNSAASLATSPIPSNAPIYNPGDRAVFDVIGRRLLVPDTNGLYTVTATVQTNGGSFQLTRNVWAGTYMGWRTCVLCHGGNNFLNLPDQATPWSKTGHAVTFNEAIDGISTDHFQEFCIACHSVGYDKALLAVNDGFDDRQKALGWVFPTNQVPGNWANLTNNYPDLAEAANVQCENCHGAGSEHAFSLGDPARISVSLSSGDCGQCHEAPPYHIKNIEWNNSRHAIATRYPTGESRASCVRCHSGVGFIDYVDKVPQRTAYEAIVCAACHDPHGPDNNPNLIRTMANVTLMDTSRPGGATTITNGGMGKLCMNCHMGRRDALTYIKPGAGSGNFGPHYGPQADMIAGVNAWTYGRTIPSSSAHLAAIGDSCVGCHLQETGLSPTNAAYGKVGGHTFKPGWDGDTPSDPSDDLHLVGACQDCHGGINTFNFPKADYNGDGIIEGVQTEVHHLLEELGNLLPPAGPTVVVTSSFTTNQLQAAFNYLFVEEDGSYGVHNLNYAVGLLRASIADLTPDADKDGLLDAWERANFNGSLAYNGLDDPDMDGLNNALEAGNFWGQLTSHPNNSDTDGDGFSDLAELRAGSSPVDPNDKPGFYVQMLPAGEVEFPSVVGKTYVIQMISDLSTTWQNVTTNLPGTGDPISHLVSYRDGGSQAFYRVVTVQP